VRHAQEVLVRGHLAAGRPDLAELALRLNPEMLALLDRWLTIEMRRAHRAGAVAALAAVIDAE
jgi:hypothetical protein